MTHPASAGAVRRARRTVLAGVLAACAFGGLAVAGTTPAHAISPCQNLNPRDVPPWCSKVPGYGDRRLSAPAASAARTHMVSLRRTKPSNRRLGHRRVGGTAVAAVPPSRRLVSAAGRCLAADVGRVGPLSRAAPAISRLIRQQRKVRATGRIALW